MKKNVIALLIFVILCLIYVYLVNNSNMPKIKKHYDSVYDYWQDMKKVQDSYTSYNLSLKKTEKSITYSDVTDMFESEKNVNHYKKGNMYKDISSYIFNENGTITKNPLNEVIFKNNNIYIIQPEIRKDTAYKMFQDGDKNEVDIQRKKELLDSTYENFNWYEAFLDKNSAPVFKDENANYNGFACRLITFNEESKKYYRRGRYGSSSFKKEVCVSDKYGIAVYTGTYVTSSLSTTLKNELVNNIKTIETNKVDNKIFNVPENVVQYNDSVML